MDEYRRLRKNYFGLALPDIIDVDFDTKLVSNIILALQRGKAPDIDGLTSEHILFGHPILPVIISKLIPKPKDTKAMTYDDFRGIAITPILCKVFEYCLLEKFQSVLASGVN